jgi:23S rRNA pseudouridine2605 synthase
MESRMALERLQKIISRSGLASRRKAEEWIIAGRITVNGHVVRELGTKADFSTDHIQVDGKAVRPPSRLVYLALHKPRGCVTTRFDPEGRPTVMNLLKKVKERVYPVGRLDYNTEGLLFLTNDGEFANRLTASRSAVLKTYWVKVKGLPQEKDLEKLRRGVLLNGRRTLPARIRRLRTTERANRTAPAGDSTHDGVNSWHEVILSEGRQNQIRKMFSLIGHPVQKLKRIQIGAVALGGLPSGEFRSLTPAEVSQLMGDGRVTPPRQSEPRLRRSVYRLGERKRHGR